MGKESKIISLLISSFSEFCENKNVEIDESNVGSLFSEFLSQYQQKKPGPTVKRTQNTKKGTVSDSGLISSFEEIVEIWEKENIAKCSYEITRGDNKGKFCGSAATNPEAKNPSLFRCKQCEKKGKRGKKASSEVKKAKPVNVKENFNSMKNEVSSKMIELQTKEYDDADKNHSFGKKKDILGYVFEENDGNKVCIGKISPSIMTSFSKNYKKSISPLTDVEQKALQNTYGVSYLGKSKKIFEPNLSDESDSDKEPTPILPSRKSSSSSQKSRSSNKKEETESENESESDLDSETDDEKINIHHYK